MNLGSVKIQRMGSNEIGVFGLTQCHKTCSKVYLSLYIERKVNGSYGTYKILEYTANNATNLSKTLNIAVPSGTYYRVRGYHAASQQRHERIHLHFNKWYHGEIISTDRQKREIFAIKSTTE